MAGKYFVALFCIGCCVRESVPEGGMRMRRRNPVITVLGVVMVAVGALILFARVLPAGFWWFCVGAGLVLGGLFLLTRRC